MKKTSYLLWGIKNKLHQNAHWLKDLFYIIPPSDIVPDRDNVIYNVNGVWKALVDGEVVVLEGASESLFSITEKITIPAGELPWLGDRTTTTIGRLLFNIILQYDNFGEVLPYIEGHVDVGDIEKKIGKLLGDTISVDQYNSFVDSVTFIKCLAVIANITATKRNILPVPGIEKARKEAVASVGGVVDTKEKLAKVEQALVKVDKENLKDDPTSGKFVSGKIEKISRRKQFLTIGSEDGFKQDGSVKFIPTSLDDGWPKDPEAIVELMNSSRSGSYKRGAETMNGGVVAKVLMRAMNGVQINEKDCGTNEAIEVTISEDNTKPYIGSYVTNNGNLTLITDENVSSFLNKKIMVRSLLYCKTLGNNYCETCAGKNMASREYNIVLAVTDVASVILLTSMKAFHGKVLTTTKVETHDLFT